ncbi:MAG: hypothetical protein ACRCWO_00860 [Bosea sp. (in: a-proteobacteria)]
MRTTTLFLASFGFAVPYAQGAAPVSEDAVKRLVTQQMCVRDCDNEKQRDLSSGSVERLAQRKYMACKMGCNDVFSGRRAVPVEPASSKTPD